MDGDGDGLTDRAEIEVMDLIAEVVAEAPSSDPVLVLQAVEFDPADPFTITRGGTPVPDLDEVATVIAEMDTIVRNLTLAVDNAENLMRNALAGLDFLEEAAAARRWTFDYDTLAAEAFDGDVDAARHAAGLYNAYCARCHTAGYSAGVAFTQEAGSGAFGPSLRAGRSVVQFPDYEDQVDFIVEGSEDGKQYGVNGVGRGWMPGFGAVLPESDIRAIVSLVRALP